MDGYIFKEASHSLSEKMWTKVGYVAVNIVLLIIYACTFGYQSIHKYLDKGIIVVEQEETNSILPPPGHLGESVTQTQKWKIRNFWNFIFCHLNIVRV